MRSIREVCIKDHGAEEIRGWGNRELGNRWIEDVKTGYVWVVEYQNTVRGVALLRIFEEAGEKMAYLNALYLTPEVLRKGLGTQLAKLMIDKARELNAKAIKLESSITGHAFYKALGFVDTGPKAQVEIGGSPVSHFPMMLVL